MSKRNSTSLSRRARNGLSTLTDRHRAARWCKPVVEQLEDRDLPSGWTAIGPAPQQDSGQLLGAGPGPVTGRLAP
jgi:hypothetical protein